MFITHNGVAVNARAIALTIVFAAVAIALNPVLIPAVFLPRFYFRFWEIPIVIAFLLLGPKSGVIVALLNTIAQLTIFLGPAGILGPPVALIGTLIMLLGLYVADRLLKRKASRNENLGKRPIAYFTALGTFFRMAFACPFVTYLAYGFLLPLVGFRFTEPEIIALIPLVLLFDLILSLITIPPAYLIARIVSRNLKVGNQLYNAAHTKHFSTKVTGSYQ